MHRAPTKQPVQISISNPHIEITDISEWLFQHQLLYRQLHRSLRDDIEYPASSIQYLVSNLLLQMFRNKHFFNHLKYKFNKNCKDSGRNRSLENH